MKKMAEHVRFQRPPINEMALGMQFASSLPFRTFDYADAWAKFGRDRYPNYMEVQPLDPIALPNATSQIIFQIPLGGPQPQRYWFLSEKQERLIQLQSNRLLYNWRLLEGDASGDYPSYHTLIDTYFGIYETFKQFAADRNFDVQPQVADLTYINIIPLQNGFDSLGDVLRGSFNLDENAGLPPSLGAVHLWQYVLDDINAMMTINANPLVTATGPALRLELYISGIFGDLRSNAAIDELRKRYDIFHKRINELFVAITTDEIQNEWGRI